MKNLLTPLLILLLAACSSSGNKETALQDSTVVADTLDVVAQPDEEPEELFENQTSDTSQLIARYEEISAATTEKHDLLYTVSITTSQYEASSDVTWQFDADISPVYFMESWAAEGNEGFTEFFIEDGEVICASSQETNEETKWCLTTGGLHTTYDDGSEGSGDPLSELLPSDYGKDCNEELSRYLDILKTILDEAEVTEEDENSYTLKKEWTINVGEDVTESTTVSIPKKVYEAVKGQ